MTCDVTHLMTFLLLLASSQHRERLGPVLQGGECWRELSGRCVLAGRWRGATLSLSVQLSRTKPTVTRPQEGRDRLAGVGGNRSYYRQTCAAPGHGLGLHFSDTTTFSVLRNERPGNVGSTNCCTSSSWSIREVSGGTDWCQQDIDKTRQDMTTLPLHPPHQSCTCQEGKLIVGQLGNLQELLVAASVI